MNILVCHSCHRNMPEFKVSLEAVISATYDPYTKKITDTDRTSAEIDMYPFDYRCPHCNALVDMKRFIEENPEICEHERVHATQYLDGSEMIKCCDCHAHVEFKPALVAVA